MALRVSIDSIFGGNSLEICAKFVNICKYLAHMSFFWEFLAILPSILTECLAPIRVWQHE